MKISNLPRISIVIPSFNQGKFLEETICSVLSQNYPNLELIIIDGGSTDNTIEIIKKYDSRITKWVSEPDRGQSHAINKGFALCTGEIMTFLGSDDIYFPNTFFDVAELFKKNPNSGAIIGAFCNIDEKSKTIGNAILPVLKFSPADLSLGPPGFYRLHQVATFFTRKALDKVGCHVNEKFKYVMDRELLYRVCRDFEITISEKIYGGFRRHEESKSVSQILPFAREFSELYLSFQNGNKSEDRKRRKMSRLHLSKGFLRLAKVSKNPIQILISLMKSVLFYPQQIFSKAFYYKIKQILFR